MPVRTGPLNLTVVAYYILCEAGQVDKKYRETNDGVQDTLPPNMALAY